MSTKENNFQVGDAVWFNDPDDDICTGRYRIEHINGEIYSLGDECGLEVEALEHELQHLY